MKYASSEILLTWLCVREKRRTQDSQSGTSSLHYRGIFASSEHNILRVVVRKRDSKRKERERVGERDALTRRRRRRRRRRWLTVVVYAATNIYLSTQRGSRYHPVLSLVRAANDMHSRSLNEGGTFDERCGRTRTKRIIKGPD